MNFKLNNGVLVPSIGFGTWQISNEDAYEATLNAIKIGYRHIDTAYAYQNEEAIGRAIKDSKIDRSELFITSKLPSDIKSYDGAKEYFNKSLNLLNLEYLDLYLIHAPWPWSNIGLDCKDGNIEAWKAMVELYKNGYIRSIGVSNFLESDIKPLIEATGFIPHVNQIRFFIGNTQEKLLKYCQDNNILVEAYSPLATGNILNDKNIIEVANKHNVTVAQVAIRYCIERNTLPLPKSTNLERQKMNLDVDFKLDKEDLEKLNKVHNKELDRPLRS